MPLRPILAALLLAILVAPPACAGTIVKLDTPIGSMTFQLYDEAKPATAANFLNYVTGGYYVNSLAHRLPVDGLGAFVLQGGNVTYDGTDFALVPTFGTIVNEPGPFPQYSNVKGTIAMAKVDGNPDSATSQWFINLRDNSGLDGVNGGFTVFGSILDGMDVLQAFSDFQNYAGGTATNVTVNASSFTPLFKELPVTKASNNTISFDDVIFTNWSVVPEPSTLALLGLAAAGLLLAFRRLPRRAPARSPAAPALR